MPAFAPPWSPQQQYQFTGILNDPDESKQQLGFFVLAGASGAVPTGGWTQISIINRPRRKSFTMPTGYDALSMDVPIRFESTVSYGPFVPGTPQVPGGQGPYWTPAQLEQSIQVLEWMAGRGKLYANGTHPAQGDPPIVQVGSYAAGSQVSTNLIPPNFHSDQADDLRWLVSNLQYDTSPIRGPDGDRTQQDVTVSLTEYVAVPGAPTSPRQRQQGRGNVSGFKSYKSTSAHNTIAKICIAHGLNKASAWRHVVAFNQSRLHVRGYNVPLKLNTTVQIPKSVTN